MTGLIDIFDGFPGEIWVLDIYDGFPSDIGYVSLKYFLGFLKILAIYPWDIS